MESKLSRTLEHLAKLVSINTCNPPRNFTQQGLFAYIMECLAAFTHTVWDHGDGRISLLAVRGEPSVLFNFHLDTVPTSDGWTTHPWTLTERGDKVLGLGSCDIKGASACMLTAAECTDKPLALLFTSDEEAGNSYCVREFIRTHDAFKQVVVAEPTMSNIVSAHRGIITGLVEFVGVAGHASAQQGIGASAIHQAVEWSHSALGWAAQQESRSFQNLTGLRFNIGTMNGGIKPNMIAPDAQLRFGLRSLPNDAQTSLLETLERLTREFVDARLTPAFIAPPLYTESESLRNWLNMPPAPAVDFWTEAALFSQAGMEAVVWGPGHIAQAHTANEWVSKKQLVQMEQHYRRVIQNGIA